MWLLHTEHLRLSFFQGSDFPTYATLSHRWQEDEVTFDDVCGEIYAYKELKGWQKIVSCCEIASAAGFDYVWIDTCCIDKRSSAELSEAINSMYNWYRSATVCYVYLFDVRTVEDMKGSSWFSRSWTLQELLAPRTAVFLNVDWIMIGDKTSLQPLLSIITSMPATALKDFRVENHSVAQKMSWAAKRVATRIEDVAYSLLGLFDINMPLLYGEGDKAFQRLQEEIMRNSNDLSIFAWSGDCISLRNGMLARSPEAFLHCNAVEMLTLDKGYQFNNSGITIELETKPLFLDRDGSSIYYAYLHQNRHDGGCVRLMLGKTQGTETFQRVTSIPGSNQVRCTAPSGAPRHLVQLLIGKQSLPFLEPNSTKFIIGNCPTGVRLYMRTNSESISSISGHWSFLSEGRGEDIQCEVPARNSYGMVGYLSWARPRLQQFRRTAYILCFGYDSLFQLVCLAFQSPIDHCENPLSGVPHGIMMFFYRTLLSDAIGKGLVYNNKRKMYAVRAMRAKLNVHRMHLPKLDMHIVFSPAQEGTVKFDIDSKYYPIHPIAQSSGPLPDVSQEATARLRKLLSASNN